MTPGVIPCESMFVVDEIRRRARAITGPVLAISLVCYFAYHLFVGDRGLIAWLHLTQQLRDGKATLAALDKAFKPGVTLGERYAAPMMARLGL